MKRYVALCQNLFLTKFEIPSQFFSFFSLTSVVFIFHLSICNILTQEDMFPEVRDASSNFAGAFYFLICST